MIAKIVMPAIQQPAGGLSIRAAFPLHRRQHRVKVSAAAASGYFARVNCRLSLTGSIRPALTVVIMALAVALLAGCALQQPPAHPNPIIVREFSYSTGVVTLD